MRKRRTYEKTILKLFELTIFMISSRTKHVSGKEFKKKRTQILVSNNKFIIYGKALIVLILTHGNRALFNVYW